MHSGFFWIKNGHFWGLSNVKIYKFLGKFRVDLVFGGLKMPKKEF